MSTTTAPPVMSPAWLLEAAGSALHDLHGTLWGARPAAELLGAKRELERVRAQLAAIDAELSCEIAATNAAASEGWASAKDYLTLVAGGPRGAGGRLLRTGRALTTDRELTLQALREARISPEQAEVIVAAVDRLPMKPSLRERAERLLLADAERLDATELEKAGAHILAVVDPDGEEKRDERALRRQERAAHLNRHLTIVEDGIGGVRIRGRGTVEDAAVINAALFPLTTPLPAGDPECDEDGKDPREHSTRLWDALVDACQRVLDAQLLPESHGMKPRVSVTIDHRALRDGIGEATLETGESLSASAVRKLACDAQVLPVVLGGAGEVLDVGRSERFVTGPIWTALVARDAHCAFPGCRRPPIACDAHHVVHWADGGPTSLSNLVLLCRGHHTMVHQTPWEVRVNPADGRPEFLPPRRLDPEQRPRRDMRPRE